MKKSLFRFSLILFSFFLMGYQNLHAEQIVASVESPDKNLHFDLILDGGAVYYQVNNQTEQLLSKSKLGIRTSAGDFSTKLTYVSSTDKAVDESYTLPSGKKNIYLNNYNELTVVFDRLGKAIRIKVRMYKDGFAFKYVFEGSGNMTIASESSEFVIKNLETTWSQVFSKNFNTPFSASSWQDMECLRSSTLPLLAKAGTHYFLVSEAENSGIYAPAKIRAGTDPGSLLFYMDETVNSIIPFETPWRVILIGSMPTIVESVTIENLNPPTLLSDLSWIKPGKSSWSYGGEDASDYLRFDILKSYIDWTKEMGWQYFTLDRNWNRNNVNFTLKGVVDYANSKSVGIFVWLNQATLPSDKVQMKSYLKSYSDIGIKGLKVDFWEDDSQQMMQKYKTLLNVSSELKLLVNLHSCTKPMGSRRTWPNLLTTDAALTGANYAFNPELVTARNNINLTLIRNVIGPLDYSPTDYADKYGKVLQSTTFAHQMALAVAFESGLQSFMDSPANYQYSLSKDFFKILPVSWDDIKCLEAKLDTYSTIARKKGDDWFVASICDSARVFDLPLSFLSEDKTYNAYIYKDGECRSEIAFEYREGLRSTDFLPVSLLSGGGITVHFSTSKDFPKPEYVKYEAESLTNKFGVGVTIATDADSLCSGNKYVSNIGKPRSLTFQKVKVPESGDYAVSLFYMSSTLRKAFIQINGDVSTKQEYTFEPSSGNEGSALAIKNILVHLDANKDNTIEIGNTIDYAPNIDRILVQPIKSFVSAVKPAKTAEHTSSVYAVKKSIYIKNNAGTQFRIVDLSGQQIASGQLETTVKVIPIQTCGVYIVQLIVNNKQSVEKVILLP